MKGRNSPSAKTDTPISASEHHFLCDDWHSLISSNTKYLHNENILECLVVRDFLMDLLWTSLNINAAKGEVKYSSYLSVESILDILPPIGVCYYTPIQSVCKITDYQTSSI